MSSQTRQTRGRASLACSLCPSDQSRVQWEIFTGLVLSRNVGFLGSPKVGRRSKQTQWNTIDVLELTARNYDEKSPGYNSQSSPTLYNTIQRCAHNKKYCNLDTQKCSWPNSGFHLPSATFVWLYFERVYCACIRGKEGLTRDCMWAWKTQGGYLHEQYNTWNTWTR